MVGAHFSRGNGATLLPSESDFQYGGLRSGKHNILDVIQASSAMELGLRRRVGLENDKSVDCTPDFKPLRSPSQVAQVRP
jgi:hypothetical protein